jgi:ATP-dependent DNA ligase
MEYVTLYNRAKTGAIRFWQIAVEGNRIITRFGQKDGLIQEVVDYGYEKNQGKANFLTAEEDAANIAERMIRKKMREGYSRELAGAEFEPFVEPLPDKLAFYKPQNSLNARMERMLEARTAWAVRKYDGEMMVLERTLEGELRLYSRRMLQTPHHEDSLWLERFPHLEMIKELIPPGTILLGEMTGAADVDNRWLVAQVMKSKTARAQELQSKEGDLIYRVWDVAWYDGEKVLGELTYRERHALYENIFDAWVIRPAEVLKEGTYSGVAELRQLAHDAQWEGFVIVDPDSTYDDDGFNLRGKPVRPATCCKLKPFFEDDFIARWDPARKIGKYGRGKNTGRLGAVALYQINNDGEEVYICDCGNGWTDDFIDRSSDPGCWPKVLQVRYESRTYISDGEDTNALQFPRFMLERTDKELVECINPNL